MKLFRTTIIAIPRNADAKDLEMAIDGLECMQIEISNTLETQFNSQNIGAKESHFERHKQSSKSDIDSDLELGFEKKQRQNLAGEPETVMPAIRLETKQFAKLARSGRNQAEARPADSLTEKPVQLGLVLKACPDILDYAKSGIDSWRDLMGAAVLPTLDNCGRAPEFKPPLAPLDPSLPNLHLIGNGKIYKNKNGLLPIMPDGYYRTISKDLGPLERWVIGQGGERYYTTDHYDSFIGPY